MIKVLMNYKPYQQNYYELGPFARLVQPLCRLLVVISKDKKIQIEEDMMGHCFAPEMKEFSEKKKERKKERKKE